MSKEKFDDLKKRLQEAEDASMTDEDGFPREPSIENKDCIPEQLKVMDSDIFHEGQLKGKKIGGSSKKYVKYQINDIEDFVDWVGQAISTIDINFKYQYFPLNALWHRFNNKDFESMINALNKDFGSSTFNKMNKVKSNFMALFEELQPKIGSKAKNPLKENVDSIFGIFKRHIPDAPDQTIAVRISELLNEFGIEVKSGTILQRMNRERKRRAKNNPS
jgi:hypothetical protein